MGTARAEALLRAASLLLASRDTLPAVRSLHDEVERELGGAPPADQPAYITRIEAQRRHRSLFSELCQRRSRSRPQLRAGGAWPRFVLWVSWSVFALVTAGLVFRYAYALRNRAKWQHEYPNGPWISNYYTDVDFQQLLLTRYDVGIDYDWGKGPPAEAMARDRWSGTWDTCIVTPAKVKVKLRLIADDNAKLIVDDVLQLRVLRRVKQSGTVTFSPGVHHLRVEYQESRRAAKLQLRGLNFSDNQEYRFERPHVEGGAIRCDVPAH